MSIIPFVYTDIKVIDGDPVKINYSALSTNRIPPVWTWNDIDKFISNPSHLQKETQ